MKILQVNDRYNLYGGTEEYVKYISQKLVEQGHEVFVLFEEGELNQNDDRSVNELVNRSVKVFKLPLSNLIEVGNLIRNLKPDVANLHNIQSPYTIQKINHLVPTVRYIHDHRVVCPGFSKFYLSNESVCPLPFSPRCALSAYTKRCATRRPPHLLKRMREKPFELEVNRTLPKILVASKYMKGELIKNKFDPQKIVVLPDPIEVPSDFEISYGDFILFVGRLTVEKGLKYLLQAMVKVPSEIKLKIVGDGPERLEDQELTASLGLSDRVIFTGWLPYQKVCELYARCRFLVFPSVWPEPYGRTGPEAMSFQKPVVGFNVGAVSEWLEDGKSGFALLPKDISGLVEKINLLWDNREMTERLGQSACEFIKNVTDPGEYFVKLEKIYELLL